MESYALPNQGWSIYINYLKFFHRRSLSILTYLFNLLFIYLIQCELMQICFIHWVIIQYYFIYFVAHIFPDLTIGNSFSWPLCLFDSFLAFPSFMALWDVTDSSCVFSVLLLEPAIFQGPLISSQKNVIRTDVWLLLDAIIFRHT